MARQLKETANAAQAVAIPEGTARTVPADDGVVIDSRPSYAQREWKPYTTADELPQAEYKEIQKRRRLEDGTFQHYKEMTCVKTGEPRYKITPSGELIKVYSKHGGTGTKLVFKFKKYLIDTKEAKEKNKHMKDFRNFLRSKKIPGA